MTPPLFQKGFVKMNDNVTVLMHLHSIFLFLHCLCSLALVELIEGGGGLWWCKINPVTP